MLVSFGPSWLSFPSLFLRYLRIPFGCPMGGNQTPEIASMDSPFDGETEFEGRTFKSLTLNEQELRSIEFYDCAFVGCSFVETTFRDCRFRGCQFDHCDLSLAHVPNCSFSDTRFEDSRALGIDWAKASWAKEGLLNSIHFFDCAISYSVFFGLSLREITITRCVAKEVDFAEANLTRANCTHTDFSESRFLDTNLTEADFTGATNYAIDAGRNVLAKTRFSLPEAMSLLHSLDIVLTDVDRADGLSE